ncbi:MAG: signal peptidase I [Chloroflexi bacterium]|nr:signal peptidase I [Chloroflexota bacterium]
MYYTSRKKKRPLVRELIETIILAGLIFVLIQATIQNYQVEGSSMVPTLAPGECVLTNKITYSHFSPGRYFGYAGESNKYQNDKVFLLGPPQHGDIVVFKYPHDPSRHFVKRVIGTPGDQIAIVNGMVSVNQKKIYEPYINSQSSTSNMNPVILHSEEYFVLGDNRQSSNDSRTWGPIKNEHIIGEYWLSYGSLLCDVAPIYKGNLR